LERLGLAGPLGSARWRLSEHAEPTTRAAGRAKRIIRRTHSALANHGIESSVPNFAVGTGTPQGRSSGG
jgi:hypothetical protein